MVVYINTIEAVCECGFIVKLREETWHDLWSKGTPWITNFKQGHCTCCNKIYRSRRDIKEIYNEYKGGQYDTNFGFLSGI